MYVCMSMEWNFIVSEPAKKVCLEMDVFFVVTNFFFFFFRDERAHCGGGSGNMSYEIYVKYPTCVCLFVKKVMWIM